MKSRSFRAVALTVATAAALIGSVPMVTSAADEAVEIASRASVTANDVQVAGRGIIEATGRKGIVEATGRKGIVEATGRRGIVEATGRS